MLWNGEQGNRSNEMVKAILQTLIDGLRMIVGRVFLELGQVWFGISADRNQVYELEGEKNRDRGRTEALVSKSLATPLHCEYPPSSESVPLELPNPS